MVMLATESEVGEAPFVPLAEVVIQAGVNERIVRKRLREAGVQLFADPWDVRRRLVRREDLVRLLSPQPVAAKAV